MNSAWKDIEKAFEPMFTESIVVQHDDEKQTIEAAVFIDSTSDSLDDGTLDTDREDIQIVCNKKDWGYVSKLLRGDLIQRTEVNGVKYKVAEVKHDYLMGWCIHARSI